MDWISRHRVGLVITVLVVGFLVVAFLRTPPADGTLSAFALADTTHPMTMGNKNAPVSLVQYSDFICPSCSYFSTQVMPTIEKKYIQTGKVKFEFRPMAFIADGSTQGGMGAYCAVDQQKFWQYHNAVYTYVAQKELGEGLDPKTQTILTASIVKQLAASAGLNESQFDSCLDSGKHLADIQQATTAANQYGVTSTPYIMVNGKKLQGNPTLPTVEAMIDASK